MQSKANNVYVLKVTKPLCTQYWTNNVKAITRKKTHLNGDRHLPCRTPASVYPANPRLPVPPTPGVSISISLVSCFFATTKNKLLFKYIGIWWYFHVFYIEWYILHTESMLIMITMISIYHFDHSRNPWNRKWLRPGVKKQELNAKLAIGDYKVLNSTWGTFFSFWWWWWW